MKLDAKTIATLILSGGKTDAIWFDDTLPGFGYRCAPAPAVSCCARGWRSIGTAAAPDGC